jgi:hypothetical protein
MQLAAYFDESGTAAKPALVVAGYVAPVQAWKKFSRAWRKLLHQEQLAGFHRTDMEWPFYGEFKKWRLDPVPKQTQVRVLQECHAVIRSFHVFATAYSVRLHDYNRIVARHPLREWLGTPYFVCAGSCVASVLEWANADGQTQPIRFYFERGATGAPAALASIRRSFRDEPLLGPMILTERRSVLPLQAADFLAYEFCKHIENRHATATPTRPIRRSVVDLVDDSRSVLRDIDGAGIRAAADRIMRRSSNLAKAYFTKSSGGN